MFIVIELVYLTYIGFSLLFQGKMKANEPYNITFLTLFTILFYGMSFYALHLVDTITFTVKMYYSHFVEDLCLL